MGRAGWIGSYFGARYYDPESGRFLSVDPLADRFPSLCPYNYCFNNPLNLVDPDGRAPGGVLPLPGVPLFPPIPDPGTPAYNAPGRLLLMLWTEWRESGRPLREWLGIQPKRETTESTNETEETKKETKKERK